MQEAQEMRVPSLGWEDSPEKGNGYPLQYSCMGNPMDRGAWRATVHGVARVRHNLVTKSPPPSVLYIVGAQLLMISLRTS